MSSALCRLQSPLSLTCLSPSLSEMPQGSVFGRRPTSHRNICTKVLLAEGRETPFTEHCRSYESTYRVSGPEATDREPVEQANKNHKLTYVFIEGGKWFTRKKSLPFKTPNVLTSVLNRIHVWNRYLIVLRFFCVKAMIIYRHMLKWSWSAVLNVEPTRRKPTGDSKGKVNT